MLGVPWLLLAACLVGQTREQPGMLTRLDEAVALVAQGERGRQMLEVAALPPARSDEIRQIFREATSALESLAKEIAKELPLRRRGGAKSEGLSADELSRLSEQVQYQLARASKNRGLLFEPGSDDRLSLLVIARDTLQRVMPQVPDGEPLKQQVQLDLAECYRLLGRYEEATQLAEALERDCVPARIRERAKAERIRAAIGQNRLDEAMELAQQQENELTAAPELSLARFEACLALVQAAEASSERADRLQKQALQAVQVLEKEEGGYWWLRAGQLLARGLSESSITNAELVRRGADSLYLNEQFERAIETYGLAVEQAKNAMDSKLAFALACKAALVEQKLGRHVAASRRLRAAALGQPGILGAPQAHLLAAWNASRAAKSDGKARELYEELLREHLMHWPDAESVQQARQWLGAP